MRVIFVEDHIESDDDFDFIKMVVPTGMRGVLLDRENGIIKLDSLSSGTILHPDDNCSEKMYLIYGIIEGVQPSKYISIRTDLG